MDHPLRRIILMIEFLVNTAPPPARQWMPTIGNFYHQHRQDLGKFTVLCYNVLCDKYATNTLYSYCPSWALAWNYRKEKILRELQEYDADIITLQVDQLAYFDI